jgi:hypothetical protein
VRPDRLASQRQRLRRQADAFEFNALIQGVSTLEDSEEQRASEKGSGGDPIVPAAVTLAEATASVEPELAAASDDSSEAPTMTSTEQRESREERLHTALEALGTRLLQEVGKMGAAMRAYDAQEAGFYLAHVNQLLELLHSVDPEGDVARQYRTTACPPEGRTWFPTAWSLAELAESPFSALLPPDADDEFARELIYAAWGVEFTQNDA